VLLGFAVAFSVRRVVSHREAGLFDMFFYLPCWTLSLRCLAERNFSSFGGSGRWQESLGCTYTSADAHSGVPIYSTEGSRVYFYCLL